MSAAVAVAWRNIVGPKTHYRADPVAFLDIGSTKVCCYVARRRGSRGFTLLGRGYQQTEGLERGIVSDTDAVEDAIQAAVAEAEAMAGMTVREIAVAVSGCAPRTKLMKGTRALSGRSVTEDDIEALLGSVRLKAQGEGRQILHIAPLTLGIDGGRAVKDPCGLAAQSLDMWAVVVSVADRALNDILGCVRRSHLEIEDVVVSSFAAGKACLAPEEVERGSILIDLGGGTTGVSFFAGGRLAFIDQVPLGGEDVTADLALELRTAQRHAERLKSLYGSVQGRSCDDNKRIEVPIIGDHVDQPTGEVPRAMITQIIRNRVRQIFDEVQDRMRESRRIFEIRPPKTLVLTGGGSQLEGIDELAEEMFELPVRRARPDLVVGREGVEDLPCCAAASGGLALVTDRDPALSWNDSAEANGLARGVVRMSRWLRENF